MDRFARLAFSACGKNEKMVQITKKIQKEARTDKTGKD